MSSAKIAFEMARKVGKPMAVGDEVLVLTDVEWTTTGDGSGEIICRFTTCAQVLPDIALALLPPSEPKHLVV
jgi:hypothetical protein